MGEGESCVKGNQEYRLSREGQLGHCLLPGNYVKPKNLHRLVPGQLSNLDPDHLKLTDNLILLGISRHIHPAGRQFRNKWFF